MKKNLLNTVLVGLSLLLSLTLNACGGGTNGTDGGGDLRLGGIVNDASGNPLSGTLVTLEETGDSATTNQNGQFLLETSAVEQGHLMFERSEGSLPLSARTGDIDFSQQTDLLNLKITVSVESGEAVIDNFSVIPATPTPRQTPQKSETPVSGRSALKGRVVFSDSSPVEGAKVSLIGQKGSDVTDKNGAFLLSFPADATEVEFLVTLKNAFARVHVRGLSSGPLELKMQIRLLIDPNSANVANTGEVDKQVKYSISKK